MARNRSRTATRAGAAVIWIAAAASFGPSPGSAQVWSEPAPVTLERLLPADLAWQAPSTQAAEGLDIKSESTALWLSLGATVVPTAIGVLMIASDDSDVGALVGSLVGGAGLYFGPAVGYWYGAAAGRGWKGVGIRFGTGFVAGLTSILICGENCDLDSDEFSAAGVITLIGGAVIVGSAIYDIAKVRSHVRKANDAKRADAARLSIAPILSPAGGGTAGVVARVTF